MTHNPTPARITPARVLWRWLSGAPLDGRGERTDAGWLVPGTVAWTRTGRAPRWAYRPRLVRAGIRTGITAATAAATTGYVLAPVPTELAMAATATVTTAYGARRTVRAVRTARHRRQYVRPLHAVLVRVLALPPSTPLDRVLMVPLDFRDPDYSRDAGQADNDDQAAGHALSGTVRVMLPATLSDAPDLQRVIHRTVAAKLGVPAAELDARWHMVGAQPYATFRRAPRPPRKVTYQDVTAALSRARDGAPVLGIGTRDRVVTVDLDTDAPHVAVSCGSGAGKSVLLRGLIAQFLHHGTQVVICDAKQTSQKWCKDLPGVTYCRTGEQMHDAVIAFAAEVRRRSEIVDSTAADDETIPDVGPRMVLVFEEQNIGMQLLTEHWAAIRTKDDAKRSPALSALDYILCAGREFKAHVITVAQMFTVQAAGGNPAARENYGIRILARATRNAWLMLAPEAGPPYPKSSRTRGRMHMVMAGEPTEVQTVFLSVPEARALATAGAPVTVPATWTTTADQRQHASPADSVTDEPRRYTLAEACREGVVPLRPGALRMAKLRAGDRWPAGVVIGAREMWTADQIRTALNLADAPGGDDEDAVA